MLSARHIRLLLAALVMTIAVTAPVRAQTAGNPQILNTASCEYLAEPSQPPPGGSIPPASPVQVLSNQVVTQVVPEAALESLTLAVSPTGTVAPGQMLTYTLTAGNDPSEDLTQVRVILPLDPGLDPPATWTDGFAPLATGGQLPVTATYDPAGPALIWDLPLVGAGQTVLLQVQAPVRMDLAAESQIVMRGQLDAAELLGSEFSNSVISTVVPPVLTVRKIADRTSAAPGDAVGFNFLVTHAGSAPGFSSVDLVDFLPEGLRFVEGSVRVDGQPVAASLENGGTQLRIPLGSMAPGDTRSVRLATLVGPIPQSKDVVNRALAEGITTAGTPVDSPLATASVRLVPGVFKRDSYLIGRVFIDEDGDGLPGEDEPGVPGVLVALEDGRGAVTDIVGRWHIEGVPPGLHVARLDPATMPSGLQPMVGGGDWVGDADTRFIEARGSTLVVAHFPVAPDPAGLCTIAIPFDSLRIPLSSLTDRDGYPAPRSTIHLDQAAALLLESTPDPGAVEPQITCEDSANLPPETLTELGSRLRRASANRRTFVRPGADGKTRVIRQQSSPVQDAEPPMDKASDELENLVRNLPAQTAIVQPADGSTAGRRSIDVEVVYPADATPELRINGVVIPASRIGTSSVLPSRGLAASRYVGIPLAEGPNQIHLRALPAAGGETDIQEADASVYLPGQAVDLRLSVPEGRWVADGSSPAVLRIESVDGAGQTSLGREVVSLMIEGARPLGVDLLPDEEGWQVRLYNGVGQVRVAPMMIPGHVQVQAFTDDMETELIVPVVPGGGQWVVSGLAEGRLAGNAGVEGDGGLAPGLDDGISDSGARIALLARGPIGDASRLTVSVDTERERDRDRLFGPYEPDEFFPTPGDASVRVDQAQTQGPLFVRLDAPMGFAQWGDFASGFRQTELARYDRRLNGLSGEVTRGLFSFAGFAASTDQMVVRDVFSPDGTSGPFLLRQTPVVARSETVIIETRDRWRTEQVIARQVKVRDIDYSLDPVSGTILFRGPVAPFDASLNPTRVVVLYESRTDSSDRITAGGRVGFRPAASFDAGATLVHEDRAGDPLDLFGIDLGWRPLPSLQIRTEVAHTEEGEGGSTSYRFMIAGRRGADFDWEVAYRELPLDFANPTLLDSPDIGTRRGSAVATWRPSDLWYLRGEALVQDDDRTGLERRVVGVESERRMGPVTALGAVRGVSGSRPGEEKVNSVLLEAGVRGKFSNQWTGELLRRQVLGDENVPGYPTRTSAGLSWEFRDGMRAVLRHEIESGDGPNRDRTLLGVESRIGPYTRSFANYSLQQGAEGSLLRSTTGIDTSIPVSSHGTLNLAASRINTTQGVDLADFSTLAGGYEHLAGATRVSGRYELRIGQEDLRHLLIASVAFHASRSWTLFARERLSYLDPKVVQRAIRAEGLLGLTYRPLGGRWRFLSRLDHSTISGSSSSPAGLVPGEDGTMVPARPGLGFEFPRDEPGVSHDSLALTFSAGAQLTRNQRVATSLIVKLADDGSFAALPSTITDLVSLHYTAMIHPRWTLGGSVRRFAQEELDETSFGAGLELGFLVLKNMWLTGGYNVAGFNAPGFPAADRTEQGGFISFRIKFDEKDWIPWRATRLDQVDTP